MLTRHRVAQNLFQTLRALLTPTCHPPQSSFLHYVQGWGQPCALNVAYRGGSGLGSFFSSYGLTGHHGGLRSKKIPCLIYRRSCTAHGVGAQPSRIERGSSRWYSRDGGRGRKGTLESTTRLLLKTSLLMVPPIEGLSCRSRSTLSLNMCLFHRRCNHSVRGWVKNETSNRLHNKMSSPNKTSVPAANHWCADVKSSWHWRMVLSCGGGRGFGTYLRSIFGIGLRA